MKQQRKSRPIPGTTQLITKAVTHIRLLEVNPGKLAALDQLAAIYLTLCQQYVTLFCTEVQPDKFHAPVFVTSLSVRWHRVAIQQAAGIAHSWRTKRGMQATRVKSAYSSQECSVCHYVDKQNRPNQQTFCCQVCGHSVHADLNASVNIQHRLADEELRACKG
ncbi:MAG TPA: zinc ribbon domain-containing protein, partial [Ktedonobacteraceae bacterium]|nr:zinc ribbon domain-containing protein [Ktedonobacteraceae bacterium]